MADYPNGGNSRSPPPAPQYASQPPQRAVPQQYPPSQPQYPQGQYSQQGLSYPQGEAPIPQHYQENQQQVRSHPQQLWDQSTEPAPYTAPLTGPQLGYPTQTPFQAPPAEYQNSPTGQQAGYPAPTPGYQGQPTGPYNTAPVTGYPIQTPYQGPSADYRGSPTGQQTEYPAPAPVYQGQPGGYRSSPTGQRASPNTGGYPPPPQQNPAGYGAGAPYHPAAPSGQYPQRVQQQHVPAAAYGERSNAHYDQQHYRGAPGVNPAPRDQYQYRDDVAYGQQPRPEKPVYRTARGEWEGGHADRREEEYGGREGDIFRTNRFVYQPPRNNARLADYGPEAMEEEELQYRLSLLNRESPPESVRQRRREMGPAVPHHVAYNTSAQYAGPSANSRGRREFEDTDAASFPSRSSSPDYWGMTGQKASYSEEWLRTAILTVLHQFKTVTDPEEKKQKMVTVEFLTKLLRSYGQGSESAVKGCHFEANVKGFMGVKRDISWLNFLKEMRDDGLLKIHMLNADVASTQYVIYAPDDKPAPWVTNFPITN